MKMHYKVIIIGAGPAGIGVANALQSAGIDDFIILERETEFGGTPRHCCHPSFGIKTCFRPVTGPDYIQRISAKLAPHRIITCASVIAIKQQGTLIISTPAGIKTVQGERIVLATGARETPRHPRLISGLRPLYGIMTTGTLQQRIYLNHQPAPKYPVIVGTEIVSFSALWTLHNSGSQVVAMLEEQPRPSIWKPASLISRLWCTPIYYQRRIVNITGLDQVNAVEIKNNANNTLQKLSCDAVIFSGKFVGENTLVRHSHLQQHPQAGYPLTDQYGQCSDPCYFAAGNMLHPVDTGENCYLEGIKIGGYVLDSLLGQLPVVQYRLPLEISDPRISFSAPGAIAVTVNQQALQIRLRLNAPMCGRITLHYGGQLLSSTDCHGYAQQQLILKNVRLPSTMEARLQLGISCH